MCADNRENKLLAMSCIVEYQCAGTTKKFRFFSLFSAQICSFGRYVCASVRILLLSKTVCPCIGYINFDAFSFIIVQLAVSPYLGCLRLLSHKLLIKFVGFN